MSTDWIKMRVDLRTHPKVVRMATALKADKLRVIGGLFAVWSIFDAHSADGVLEGYTLRSIDDELGWSKFAQAMVAIDWLIERPDLGLETPRFEEHNGQSAKRRAMETDRKRAAREASGDDRTKAERVADWAGQPSAPDADTKRAREEKRREEKRREEKDQETINLPVDPARLADEPQALQLVGDPPNGPPDCPHRLVLALWAEVLPSLPQHLPHEWKGSRADHLRTRWRETAVLKGWTEQAHGIAYLRKLFAYVGQSAFLTGRARPTGPDKRPFVIELEWLVNPTNWAKVHEGKYHQDAAA